MALILASTSPRRRELLGMLGLSFTVLGADIDETMDPRRGAETEVSRICPGQSGGRPASFRRRGHHHRRRHHRLRGQPDPRQAPFGGGRRGHAAAALREDP